MKLFRTVSVVPSGEFAHTKAFPPWAELKLTEAGVFPSFWSMCRWTDVVSRKKFRKPNILSFVGSHYTMLTPAFELTQDDRFLTILIKAPYTKVSETEIFVEENDFKFFSKPYFLRLTLPGNIVEDGQEKAEYNADKGEFSLTFAKRTPGEVFEGLDMITKLLAPKGSKSASQPLIEVIDDSSAELPEKTVDSNPDRDGVDAEDRQDSNGDEFDWTIQQTPYEEKSTILTGVKYGFANQKSGVFLRLQEELCDVVDCPDPENMVPAQRKETRLAAENAKFDAEHYLGDFLEDEMIQPFIDYIPPWSEQISSEGRGSSVENEAELTEEDREVMRKLPKKEYLLEELEETAVYLGLVDIMYAYAYNYRVSEGESNVEAGWNISKLSATLSWFEVYSNLQDVLITCYRRCLCYPLHRNWKLCTQVLNDVKQIFRLGRGQLLKCLLAVRGLLIDTDSRYILNDLYITDYCVWIQQTSRAKLQSFTDAVQKVTISKDEVGFNLIDLEQLAQNALDNSDLDSVTDQISDLNVDCSKDSDDDSSEYASDTTDSDDETSDSDISSEEEEADVTDDIDVKAVTDKISNFGIEVIDDADADQSVGNKPNFGKDVIGDAEDEKNKENLPKFKIEVLDNAE